MRKKSRKQVPNEKGSEDQEKHIFVYWYSITESEVIRFDYCTGRLSSKEYSHEKFYVGFAFFKDSIYLCGISFSHKECQKITIKEVGDFHIKFVMQPLPDLKFGRINSGAEIINGMYLYSIGGGTNKKGICEKLNLSKKQWVRFPSLNQYVQCPTVCCIDSRYLYQIGGYLGQINKYSKIIEYIDAFDEEKGWTIIKTYPHGWSAREIPGCLQSRPNTLLIFGGRCHKSNNYILKKTIYQVQTNDHSMQQIKRELVIGGSFGNTKPVIIKGNLYIADNEHDSVLHINLNKWEQHIKNFYS